MLGTSATLIYASTNKVYGGLQELEVQELETRYDLKDNKIGVSELQPLKFRTPYGCSKGAAEQYVLDYHHTYKLSTVVLRQSCICGTHQIGSEEQGWVAWFVIAHLLGLPIRVFGDGKQVRDLLYVDDLVELYQAILDKGSSVSGTVYNIGGGFRNALSIRELMHLIGDLTGHELSFEYGPWRPGDQKVYISDIGRVEAELGWYPRIGPRCAVEKILTWAQENTNVLSAILRTKAVAVDDF
jgi:CDP-paratose 2-epimerase